MFGVIVGALVVYLAMVGLDEADKLASSIGAVLALSALGAPYLLPWPGGTPAAEPNRAEDTGSARAAGGGQANTGLQALDAGRPVQVARTGDTFADGPGSVANTGVQRGPGRDG
ncbi:hypothetical protein BCD49_34500 [Pseudofrankia sp. EUN1h]|nr:hypothetical protein BCD49_34500 [Pseudofrankia sp. EUN1h]